MNNIKQATERLQTILNPISGLEIGIVDDRMSKYYTEDGVYFPANETILITYNSTELFAIFKATNQYRFKLLNGIDYSLSGNETLDLANALNQIAKTVQTLNRNLERK